MIKLRPIKNSTKGFKDLIEINKNMVDHIEENIPKG